MKTQERIRVDDFVIWAVCSALVVLFFVLQHLGVVTAGEKEMLSFGIFAVILIPGTLWKCVHSTFLTAEGVECCRFGKVIRRIAWEDTAQVCILREFPLSAKTSSPGRIVIVPKGVEPFDKEKWSGSRYFRKYRRQNIAIVNEKKNREFIEAHYGEILNYCNC